MIETNDAVGGYLPLELPQHPLPAHLAGAFAYQSARAAFLAVLQAVRPRRVWVPWYICDSMVEPLQRTGIAVQPYALDASWAPMDVALGAGDLLLHVNHFGLLDHVQERLAAELPREQLVFDNAQAFYAAPRGVLATLYSPRKFFGLPDGGLLLAPGVTLPPPAADEGSLARCEHLLARHARDAEAGYASFGRAEASLQLQPPLAMSQLTRRLLQAVDFDAASARRRANFAHLAQALDESNGLRWTLGSDAVPLCYPFLARRGGLRPLLAAGRIYTPCYWPELLDGRQLPQREAGWADRLLALPIDQRYDAGILSTRLLAPLQRLLAGK